MLEHYAGAVAIALYSGLLLALIKNIDRWVPRSNMPAPYLVASLAALAAHSLSVYAALYTPDGLSLGIFSVFALICWVVNIILIASSLRAPVTLLLPPMFAVSIAALAGLMAFNGQQPPKHYPVEIALHILLSIAAYSVLVVTTGQAVMVALQDKLLREHRVRRAMKFLPPLRSMETVLFQFLTAGVVLLALSVITGFFFFDDIKTQHLAHKMFFSTAGLLVYGVLLWGHWTRGWRGVTALRLCIAGFLLLVLGYFGSKWVLEILLAR